MSNDLQHALNLLNQRQALSFQKYAQKAIVRANQVKPETGEYLGGNSAIINGVPTGIVRTRTGTRRVMIFGSNQALPGRQVVIIKPRNSSIAAIQGLPAVRNRAI